MATLFKKFRTFALSNLHTLLDKAIDLNSIGAIKQHIRDLEEAKEEIADEAAVAKGRVSAADKEMTALRAKIVATNENIDAILNDGDESNDHLAEKLDVRLQGYEQTLQGNQEEFDALKKTAEALAQATDKLNTKHGEMMRNLTRLEQLERTAAAKAKAAEALKAAAKVTAGAGEVSVDNIESRLREKATVADAKFERAMGDLNSQDDTDVAAALAKQRIAARRAKLTGGSGQK